LSLTAWLAIRPAEAEAAPERPLRLLDPKWALPVAAVLCLMAAKGRQELDIDWMQNLRSGIYATFLSAPPPPWLATMKEVGRYDDRYYLSRERPENHPSVWISLLKMKVRLARGDLDENAVRFVYFEDLAKPTN
jgi:hypothetical protein